MTTRVRSLWWMLGMALALASAPLGCTQDEDEPLPASTRNHLIWKRAHAIEQDLALALELDPETMCQELGEFSCTERVHLTTLGGHDPFEQGLYRGVGSPLVTTPLALERVAVSACTARAKADMSGDPVVFVDLELGEDAPSSGSDAYRYTVRTLYRRLLARNPEPEEYDVLAALLESPEGGRASGEGFAVAACVAVATTTEFLFF